MALDSATLLKKFNFEPDKGEPRFLDEPDSDFPKPLKRYRLIMEAYGMAVEEPYFWILNMLREGFQYADLLKLKDVFTATETSSFFGLTGTRLERQQALAMQYLAQIGHFVKELFGMIRELKTIDMRLEMYKESNKKYRDANDPNKDRNESPSAEISLKSLWVELVEGGAKNPSSVYGLAANLGFAGLPDMFFTNPAKSPDDVDKQVDSLPYNEKVKSVLKAKLFSYFEWKENSFKEYINRRKFMIKYLRQHYEIIKTYMNWVRPYLLHAKRLSLDQRRLKSPDIITAFEQSMIEVEFLAKKKGKKYNNCILAHFLYKTRPALEFTRERQHQGAIHVGRVEITLRGYTWTDEQVKAFEQMRDDEDFALLGAVDKSIDAAMNVLGDDLKNYLKEAGREEFKEDEMPMKKEETKPKQSILEPFKELAKASIEPARMIGRGFAELIGAPLPEPGKKSVNMPTKEDMKKEEEEQKKIAKDVQKTLFNLYNVFKKAHLMPSF